MNYTNIKVIMDKITRRKLLKDVPFETVVDYAIDFMRIVGIPTSFLNKVVKIHIEDYRGEMPCDFYEVNQVRPLFNNQPQGAFRHTTDTFHLSNIKPCKTDFTYTIQNSCIFTSIKNGDIEMAYKAIPVDDEGYPLIPDNSSYTRALEAYIKLQFFTDFFDEGKIDYRVLLNAQNDYHNAAGNASTSMILPNKDQMESIVNMMSKILPSIDRDHAHGYIQSGSEEHLKIH